jgi:hypothetical protein
LEDIVACHVLENHEIEHVVKNHAIEHVWFSI